MADLTALARTAQRLIQNAPGRSVTFVQLNETADDPAKPWRGSSTRDGPDPITTLAVFLPPSGETNFGTRTNNPEITGRVDAIILVAPGPDVTTDLTTYDLVRDGATEYKIQFAERLDPGNPSVAVLYQFGLRR